VKVRARFIPNDKIVNARLEEIKRKEDNSEETPISKQSKVMQNMKSFKKPDYFKNQDSRKIPGKLDDLEQD
jgi:hypothetical protein